MPTTRAHHLEDDAGLVTWDSLTRAAFATDWDPQTAIPWDEPIDRARIPDGWITILHHFYEGEWQGLEIIQRLMNRASHRFGAPEMITYYSTQCYDESKHLFVFRTYLEKLGAPPVERRTFDVLVALATRGPLAVERWILATYFTETLAAAIFQRALQLPAVDEVGKAMIRLMLKDESRHIAGTRVAVKTLMRHAGGATTLVLAGWWRLFIVLATRQVRALRPYGEEAGIDPEDILRRTFERMGQLHEFEEAFLSKELVGKLLATPR